MQTYRSVSVFMQSIYSVISEFPYIYLFLFLSSKISPIFYIILRFVDTFLFCSYYLADMKKRLDPAVFDLPVQEIRRGYRSAVYFWRTKRILEQDDNQAHVTHQVFQKKDNVVICGTDEAVAILRSATGLYSDSARAFKLFDRYIELKQLIRQSLYRGDYESYLEMTSAKMEIAHRLDDLWIDKFSEIEVRSLYDGDPLSSWETAMTIEGQYSLFAHLESLYLGVLARRTRVATNTRAIVEAARGKQVLFFADRFDHFATQGGDGYASKVGGARGVATDAMAAWYGERGLGTIPHALIVAYGGDTALATEKFHQYYPNIPAIALVDFTNDCVNESLLAARRLGDKLWGVRLDTAENLIDVSLQDRTDLPDSDLYGVAPLLVEKTRQALDAEGFKHVKIIVSGGFHPERIKHFEELGVPVDIYAVGSWMFSGRYDFTADAVRLNGKPLAKVGREYRPNPRLELVEV
jgi:nicotinate phosphoribosyltransferase